MRKIDIDTEVFSLIWSLRVSPEETENEILKRLLATIQRTNAAERPSNQHSEATEVNTSLLTSTPMQHSSNRFNSNEGDTTMFSGKIRWVDDIQAAIQGLGGEASLHQIYKAVKERRGAAGRSVPASVDATIRRTLEDHCLESANFRGVNLFSMPRGHGAGYWALR